MDLIDKKILRELQTDATIAVAELAARVGISQTPCWKRIQRLEKEGVIMRRVALVAPEKIGLSLTVFVSIETGDHSQDWLKTFADFVAAQCEVMEVYRLAGDIDYVLRVVVADIAAYDQFYKRLIAHTRFKNVSSRFSMETIKSETAYTLDSVK